MFDVKSSIAFRESIQLQKARSLNELKENLDLSYLEHKDYSIVNTPEKLDVVCRCIKDSTITAIDFETTGVMIFNLPYDNYEKSEIVGVSFSWKENQGVYIPFKHDKFKNIPMSYAFKKMKWLLENKKFVTHNGMFDGKCLYEHGIKLNIVHDTFLLLFNLNSYVIQGSLGLKYITKAIFHQDVVSLMDIFEKEQDLTMFCHVEEDVAKVYGCSDTDNTLRVLYVLLPYLLPDQWKPYVLDIRLQSHLIRSEYMGKGVNVDKVKEFYDINKQDLDRLTNLLYTYVGTKILYDRTGELKSNKYLFNHSSSDQIKDVIFNLLNYPIPESFKNRKKKSKTGLPPVDKNTIKALKALKDSTPDPVFDLIRPDDISDGILRSFNGKTKLLNWNELAGMKCKAIPILEKIRKLEKLKSSFYVPVLNNSKVGRYFSDIRMGVAETSRLVDFVQTMDKEIREAFVPLPGRKRYLVDFDFMQIELRVMFGEANEKELCEKFNNPENDIHIECGSTMLQKKPETITSEERTSVKSLNFAIPYGMMLNSIVERLYGINLTKEEKKEKTQEVKHLIDVWNLTFHNVYSLLCDYADRALVQAEALTFPPHLHNMKLSRIMNCWGRTRSFSLEDLNNQKAASIKRKAMNNPIQSYARDIYAYAVCNLSDRLIKEGLMDILVEDPNSATGYSFYNKVNIMTYIHDECLASVDSDVNCEFLYKLIYEECMLNVEGYPKFYCGINIVDNWYEGKNSKFEAPIQLIEEIIKTNPEKYIDENINQKQRALDKICNYTLRRVFSEILKISPNVRKGIVNVEEIDSNLTNYFVRPRFFDYVVKDNSDCKSGDPEFVLRLKALCKMFMSNFTLIYPDGTQEVFANCDNIMILADVQGEDKNVNPYLEDILDEDILDDIYVVGEHTSDYNDSGNDSDSDSDNDNDNDIVYESTSCNVQEVSNLFNQTMANDIDMEDW